MAKSTDVPMAVAAFDFGTTYSGYAYSFRDAPLKVQTNQSWGSSLVSLKTPTCVLFDPDDNFHSFGSEAEEKYADLADNEEHNDWKFFRRFKMTLLSSDGLDSETALEDIGGQPMPAIKVFSTAIKFLWDHFLNNFKMTPTGSVLEESDILYILTVPAIWDDKAKDFMRNAAVEAGIDTSRLKLALEPEVASMWCETLDSNAKAAMAGRGTKYLVADMGGGTADISIYERLSGGKLKEIHQASGGYWGGTAVDMKYWEILEKIYGQRALDILKKEEMSDYYDILNEFEIKKRVFSPNTVSTTNIRVPPLLKTIAEDDREMTLQDMVIAAGYGDLIIFDGRDKLKIKPSIIQSCFDEPIDRSIQHIKGLLSESEIKDVNTILLVGGFGESAYLQDRFKKEFHDKTVIVPAEAGTTVLKGAVRFGHEPNLVQFRKLKYTYGQEMYKRFDRNIHPAEKMEVKNGKEVINHCFSVFAKANDEIAIDCAVTKHIVPTHPTATSITIFKSTKEAPDFTTDPSCSKLGTLRVDHPGDVRKEDKAFDITFIFGGTELTVKVRKSKSGKEEHLKISYD